MSRHESDFSPAFFSPPLAPYMLIPTFLEADKALTRSPQNQAGKALLERSSGKIDVIGDIHGCFEELACLLVTMGWSLEDQGAHRPIVPMHADPERRLVLLGDVVVRGPDSMSCLRLSWGLEISGRGVTLMGNNDWLVLALVDVERFAPPANGRMDDILSGVRASPARRHLLRHLERMPDHIVFNHPILGAVELVHAAPEGLNTPTGRTPPGGTAFTRIYGYCAYEDGKVRNLDWRPYHPGDRWTLFGHQPFFEPEHIGRTIALDLGQGLGGSLACLRLDDADPGSPLARVVVTGPGLPPLL